MVGQLRTRLLSRLKELRMASRQKGRLVLYSWTLQLPDTVWHRGLTCKLLRTLPNRHIGSFIMELVRNHSFSLTTGNGVQSRLRRLKNGVTQGSLLAALLFNIYTHDLPVTVARKFVYADDLAIMHFANDWQSLEETLTQDMATLLSYLQKWKLKLSTTKTVTAAVLQQGGNS